MSWSVDLLTCCEDRDLLCDVCCCWACQTARQLAALDGRQNTIDKGLCLCAAVLGPVCIWSVRARVVEKFNISELCCWTCYAACACPLCSLMQTHEELQQHYIDPGTTCEMPSLPAPPAGMTGNQAHGHSRRHH